MSLETPMKIRMLQRKLYQKAKEEPNEQDLTSSTSARRVPCGLS